MYTFEHTCCGGANGPLSLSLSLSLSFSLSLSLSLVYGAASNNILKKLDPIHHQGLRIALGAFRTSPVTSLYAKAQEMSLKNRRKKLSINYVLKLKTCPDNPAYSCVFEPPNSKLFEKSSLTPPLGIRILPLFEDSKIDLDVVDDTTVSDTPPWSQSEPQICLSLTKYKKKTPQTLKSINKHFWK